ncbi:hypothetical protein [Cohnella yongneupensis]|uniref:DUF1292 domain-containing protein n=1 Tax=Cohnella yongneupensis TaxID=425006 RepID=A0ABW0R3W2_9BACL
MNVQVLSAKMSFSEDKGYIGQVLFSVENHKQPYELTLQSDKGNFDWNYALNFSDEPGSEEEILLVDERLETDDDLFDMLVDAAKEAMSQQ